MKNRKVQSLQAWSHSNALIRVQRTLLHLIYQHWRSHLGLPVPNPYAIDYLNKGKWITLKEILTYEQ